MGKMVTPLIEAPAVQLAPTTQPAARSFHDSLAVQVHGLWSNPVHHYTTDGSDPGENSPAYDKPIVLTKTATLKVRSFLKGYQPSDVVAAKFESLGPDKAKPAVQDIVAIDDGKARSLLVVFSKKVDRATAEDAGNYTLAGAKIEEAKLDDDLQCVRLSVTPALDDAKEHRLTCRLVKDISESGNVMDEAAKAFTLRRLPGLVAWWSFDVLDGWKVKDYGPNRIDGTAYRALYFRGASLVEGRKGQAIYLKDAGDFVDVSKHVGNVDSINLDDLAVDRQSPLHADSGSVFLWIKAKAGPKHTRDIISKGYAYSLTIAGGELYVGNATGSGRKKVCPIADDAWHHLGLVFQNNVENGSKVYVDGELKTTLTMKFLPHVGTRLEISQPRNWGGSDAWLDGAIDEVMLFKGLMSDEQARQLYRDGSLSPPGPTAATSQP